MHDTTIKLARPGATINDDQVTGLHVRVTPSGKKAFYLYYRTQHGIPRRPKLGDYGTLSLADARRIARDMKMKVAEGRDPSREKQLSKDEPDMQALFLKAFAEHWSKRVPEYRKEVERIWYKDIAPRVGKLRVKDVSYQDCRQVHESSKNNHALAILSKLLRLAETYEMRPVRSNPCDAVERRRGRKRKRFATPKEISAIGQLLTKYIDQYPEHVAFLYVMMFSGARPTEIGRATPDQVRPIEHNGQTFGVLEWDIGKNKDARSIYLPPQAMAALARLPQDRKLLCGIKTPRTLWRIIRKEAGCQDLWARDWRRTFTTVGLGSGQQLDMLAELLGHRDVQTTKIYAKLMEEKAFEAVAQTASIMEKMLQGA